MSEVSREEGASLRSPCRGSAPDPGRTASRSGSPRTGLGVSLELVRRSSAHGREPLEPSVDSSPAGGSPLGMSVRGLEGLTALSVTRALLLVTHVRFRRRQELGQRTEPHESSAARFEARQSAAGTPVSNSAQRRPSSDRNFRQRQQQTRISHAPLASIGHMVSAATE